MVKLAKELGAKVWAEVTHHHFTLTEEAAVSYTHLEKENASERLFLKIGAANYESRLWLNGKLAARHLSLIHI